MPSASSCLLHVYVSQKPNIKRSPNGIKTDGELFWNIWDFSEEESTQNGVRGGHEIVGRALPPWARLAPSWSTRKAVDALLLPQESLFYEKNLGERFTLIGVTNLRI